MCLYKNFTDFVRFLTVGDEMKLPDIVAVGIYNSKYAAKNTNISKNRKTVMFEIELPIEDGGVSFIDDQTKRIRTDMLICAKPGQLRHTKFPYSCYYIHMMVSEGELFDALMSAPTFLKIDSYSYYLDIFKRLCKYYKSGVNNHEIMLQSLLLQLIYSITKDTKRNSVVNAKNSNALIIEKAVKYIKDNLTESLSLEAVSEYVALSPIYFHNCFKTAVGKTLHDFVEEIRIKEAINLLTTTNMTLTEIAYRCGFSSQSYFSFVFKRRMKTTPRMYLKQLNEQYTP